MSQPNHVNRSTAVKSGIFLLGVLLVFFCAEGVARLYRRAVFRSVSTEFGRVGNEMVDFQNRDRSKPSAILIGGSDVREDIEMTLARPYFKDRGVQLFNFAMSARDPENEKYEMISALNLQPNDIVIYSISPEDFMDSGEANPVALDWEEADAYLYRMHILGVRPSIAQYLTQKLAANFVFVRDREQLRHFFYPKAGEKSGISWHNNGDRPDDPAVTESKLAKFREIRNDANLHLDASRLKLEKVIADKLGPHLILISLPRNPRFNEVYSQPMVDKYYATLERMGVVQLGDFAHLELTDFYDINHLHSKGGEKFTEQILPKFFDQVKARLR